MAAAGEPADLAQSVLTQALPGRPIRSYPALLSTEATAQAWARTGASAGAVVVADYQVSPRGRSGMPWTVRPGAGLGFSLVLRPHLPSAREGWLYLPVGCALLDTVPSAASVSWPDEIYGENLLARFSVHTEHGKDDVEWAVVTVLIEDAVPPRASLLAEVITAIERRAAQEPRRVLADYRRRCITLDRTAQARMTPLGPAGLVVKGRAVGLLSDGALVLRTYGDHFVRVHPQNLGLIELL